MPRKKTVRRRKPTRARPVRRKTKTRRVKSKLAGFTKQGGKYALVFKKGTKLSVGKKRFTKKASMNKEAVKYI